MWGISVYKNFSPDPEGAKETLDNAGVEVVETHGTQVYVPFGKVKEAVEVLNRAGYTTDEDTADEE